MNTLLKNISVTVGVVIVMVMSTVAIFQIVEGNFSIAHASTTTTCTDGTTLSLSEAQNDRFGSPSLIDVQFANINNNGQIQATVTNNSDCSFPASLFVYRMYAAGLANPTNQEFNSEDGNTTVAPHSTKVFTADLPSCMAQIDFFYGEGPHIEDHTVSDPIGLAWTYFENNGSGSENASGNFCTHTPPPPPLVGSCLANPTTVNTGDTVTYTATSTGGTGSYTYAWSGDNVSGTDVSENTTYSTTGTKTATVVITSGTESVTENCSTTVNQPQTIPTVAISCSANPTSIQTGESATFTATSTGGDGTYTYSWTGDDNLSGTTTSVSQTYNDTGTKNATVTVTSDGQTASATCSTLVVAAQNNSLDGSCTVTPTSGDIGTMATYSASATGGSGNYTYAWTGSDSVTAATSTFSHQYDFAGAQFATVAISDGNQTIYKTCNMTINQPPTPPGGGGGGGGGSGGGGSGYYIPPTQTQVVVTPQPQVLGAQSGGVYLSQVPYTGIGDNAKVAGFIFALLAWSGGLSYLLIRYKAWKNGVTMTEVVVGPLEVSQAPQLAVTAGPRIPVVSSVVAPQAPTPIIISTPTPIQDPYEVLFTRINGVAPVQSNKSLIETLEIHARDAQTLVSNEGLAMIVSRVQNDASAATATLNHLIEFYRGDVGSDDWMVLNNEKISQALA